MGQHIVIIAVAWILKFAIVLFMASLKWKPWPRKKVENGRVQILVVGDIGRSPRMQYHAMSIASQAGKVDLIGYRESELHPEILASDAITVHTIQSIPAYLMQKSGLLFLLTAPFKVLHQTYAVWTALDTFNSSAETLLIQNPPAIPTLALALLSCHIRDIQLFVDWHNFGYSILALRLGRRHPLVILSYVYEIFLGRFADVNICVTDAMKRKLSRDLCNSTNIHVLHDRPAEIFQPLNDSARRVFLERLSYATSQEPGHGEQMNLQYKATISNVALKQAIQSVSNRETRLLISATSWTADEDFSLLLDALVSLHKSRLSNTKDKHPPILVIITGKGPLQDRFESAARDLTSQGRLGGIAIMLAYFQDIRDYAALLGSADLGLSMHTSSSGVDLPMKVVDMFGTSLPVVGWSAFEAWPELVKEGINGIGFASAAELSRALEKLLSRETTSLTKLRQGASIDCRRRWSAEWNGVAGKLLGFKTNK